MNSPAITCKFSTVKRVTIVSGKVPSPIEIRGKSANIQPSASPVSHYYTISLGMYLPEFSFCSHVVQTYPKFSLPMIYKEHFTQIVILFCTVNEHQSCSIPHTGAIGCREILWDLVVSITKLSARC